MHPYSSVKASAGAKPELIGVDWGTSSCRAYLMAGGGEIVEAVDTDKGILHVECGRFAETLDAIIGSWRRPGLPVVLSGMIGSRQGWIEAPYVPIPANFDQIAAGLVPLSDDAEIHVVPGLALNLEGQAPDVMRGEETQIIGAVGEARDRRLLVMPGTHSKWVLIDEQKVTWFATFMTGELFGVLKSHSILGRLMARDHDRMDERAFERGLEASRTLPGGLLQHLFSARTLALFDRLPETAIASYLSGLLLGHELAEAISNLDQAQDLPPLTLIGSSTLAQRYIKALRHAGLEADHADEYIAAQGQYQLAKAANLLASTPG